ncbi:hypothetical protein R1flu_022575 [Riccia fluitans]|uniref:Ribosomal protein L2 n=1 Tax=Riccia fluitans TaxID=41844 RepID=A0ABD1XPK0_9MARC
MLKKRAYSGFGSGRRKTTQGTPDVRCMKEGGDSIHHSSRPFKNWHVSTRIMVRDTKRGLSISCDTVILSTHTSV